jgi:hypothetical protein
MIPKRIKINGKEFELVVKPMTGDTVQGWWSYTYCGNEMSGNYDVGNETDGYIPYVSDGDFVRYLVTCGPTKLEAYNRMIDRINRALEFDGNGVEKVDNELIDLDYETNDI